MEIYLVRHGIAEDNADTNTDADRRLTAEGVARTGRVAKNFSKRISDIELIIHSPYKRAEETAKIFAEYYPDAEVKEGKGLTPFDKARMAMPLLSELPQGAKVMLVGHEPHLSCLASLLMTGSEHPVLEFRKAGIAGLACTGNLQHCYLMFLLTPKFLA